MIKKVYSYKFGAVISLTATGMCIIAEIISVYSLISSLMNDKDTLLETIIIVGFLPMLLLAIFIANRLAYVVAYDEEKNIIYRKGLICGYKYQLKIEDIQDIITVTFPKETTFYILVDPYNTRYDGGFKQSFIRLEKTDTSRNFIMQFWNKPIIKTVKDYTF